MMKILSGLALLTLPLLVGCGSTKILYSRATKMPEETQGLMRLAQDKVKVNVVGKDSVGEFSVDQPGAYVLVHELDYGQCVKSLDEVQRVREYLKTHHADVYDEIRYFLNNKEKADSEKKKTGVYPRFRRVDTVRNNDGQAF